LELPWAFFYGPAGLLGSDQLLNIIEDVSVQIDQIGASWLPEASLIDVHGKGCTPIFHAVLTHVGWM